MLLGRHICSDGFTLAFVGLSVGLDLWLGVRARETSSSSEILLSFSVFGTSEEEGVSTYNIN